MKIVYVGKEYNSDYREWTVKFVFTDLGKAINWVNSGVISLQKYPVDGERDYDYAELIE